MAFVHQLLLRRAARLDAAKSLDSIEARLVSQLGLRPTLNPANRQDHAQVVAGQRRSVEVEEWGEDLRRLEDEAARHTSPTALVIGIIAAVLVEMIGAVLIMRALDVPASERLPLGIALALGLVGMTALVAKGRGRIPSSGGAPPASGLSVGMVVPAVYTILVGALVVVRLQGADEEFSSRSEQAAQAIIMVFTSAGPAWAVEWLIRRYVPARLLSQEKHLVKRRIREARRAHERAARYTARLARNGAKWDEQAARLRAAYQVEHRLVVAEKPAPPPAGRGERRRTS